MDRPQLHLDLKPKPPVNVHHFTMIADGISLGSVTGVQECKEGAIVHFYCPVDWTIAKWVEECEFTDKYNLRWIFKAFVVPCIKKDILLLVAIKKIRHEDLWKKRDEQ